MIDFDLIAAFYPAPERDPQRFDGTPLVGVSQGQDTVEICRSFAYKLNLANHGGPAYESADFFVSRKLSCKREAEAMVSQELFEECVGEIQGAVKDFIRGMQQKRERITAQREEGAVMRPAAHQVRR